ncbi:type IV secretory system conjugative DNA transfer family protein [Palleronia sp. KMU-117]|uniref:type IV secretory system conjugative DNA transfer family protein n=1 Tax=Palleronia sp. KMU-117 TaxID=3434108 RepID=UPI003D719CFD
MALPHCHIIGSTGTGKSTLIKQRIFDDLTAGRGLFYLDPHGSDADHILSLIPRERLADVVLFDISDSEHPVRFNPLRAPGEVPFVATTLVEAIKDAWGYSGVSTPTMDQYLFNATYALIEAKQPLLGLKFLLTPHATRYRRRVLKSVTDPIVKDFWLDFERLPEKDKRETTRSTLNKIGMLMADRRVRNTIGQPKTSFTFTDILEDNRVFIARLPQGKLGISKVKLVGMLLLTQLHLAALSRQSTEPFHVYLDEVHHFAGATLAELLSGVRKFGLSLTVAHQYLAQLSPALREAVLGNTSLRYIFRVSSTDAKRLETIVGQNQLLTDLNQLPRFRARVVSDERPEEVDIVPDLPEPDPKTAEKVRYANHRIASDPAQVEEYVRRFIEKT